MNSLTKGRFDIAHQMECPSGRSGKFPNNSFHYFSVYLNPTASEVFRHFFIFSFYKVSSVLSLKAANDEMVSGGGNINKIGLKIDHEDSSHLTRKGA